MNTKVLSLVVLTTFAVSAFSVMPAYASTPQQVSVRINMQDMTNTTAYPQLALNSSNYFTVMYLSNNTNQTLDLYQNNAIINVDANSIVSILQYSSRSFTGGPVIWMLYNSGPQNEFIGSTSRTIFVTVGSFARNPSGVFLTFDGKPYTPALGVLKTLGGKTIDTYNATGFAELNQAYCIGCTFVVPEYFVSATGQYWQVQGNPRVTVVPTSTPDSPSSFNYVQVPTPSALFNVTVPSLTLAGSNVTITMTFPFQPGDARVIFVTSPHVSSSWYNSDILPPISNSAEELVNIPPGAQYLNVTVIFTGSVLAPAPTFGTVAGVQQSTYYVTKVVELHVKPAGFPWWLLLVALVIAVVIVATILYILYRRSKRREDEGGVQA